MKYLLLSILLTFGVTDPLKIGKINRAKKEAREAYTSGDYKTAISKFKYLIDSLGVQEDAINLNLANAYYQLKDTANAQTAYQMLTGSRESMVRSKAQHQLGIMSHQQGKLEEALEHFKQAIKADPANQDARYNYEMVKKKLEEKKKQEEQNQSNKDKQNKDQKDKDQQKKDQQNKDQQNKEDQKKDQQNKDQQKKDQEKKDQQNKEQQNKEQQNKEQQEKEKKDQQQKDQEQEQKEQQKKDEKSIPPQVSKKLEQMKISPEKAQMILEAMKNQEIQYLQQNKRKATKPKDKGKPDW